MSYTVFKHDTQFGPRKGLEGPFHYANGRTLYYDPKQGQYYDSTTDWYVSNEEIDQLHQLTMDALK